MMEYDSHSKARQLFDATADSYQQRSEARVYDFSALIFQRRIEIVKQFLEQVPPGARILDFGMGPAVFGSYCAGKDLRYLGIDISPQMVERAKALNLHNADFLVGDLGSLSAYRREMDVVLAIGLLDYLEDPLSGIKQLADCVKPGGEAILSFRNRFSLPRLLRDMAKRLWKVAAPRKSTHQYEKAFQADVHEHSFDAGGQLQPGLAELGFGKLEVRYFNCSPFFWNFPLPQTIWNHWFRWDSFLAARHTRFMCSGGVLRTRRIQS